MARRPNKAAPLIEAKKLSKAFVAPSGDPVPVLADFSLTLQLGETATLFGPNGCGKSTLLSLLAGTQDPDTGKVVRHWDEQKKGGVGFVFQNYGDVLHPWRTVRENVEFPLALQGMKKADRREQAMARLAHFRLEEHADKYVYQLSGGQKQLVTICQATVYRPHLLLCDEPFSALDYSISRRLWLLLRAFLSGCDMATVFVSHDIDEAIFLGDRVIVMSARPGRIVATMQTPFGKDRKPDVLGSPEFFRIRSQVLEAFAEGRKII